MEKALVVPDVQALAEIVAHGETGLIYRKGDVQHLAESLTRLIKDPELTARLGRQGRKWVIENRTWKRAGKLVVDVYDRIRAKGGGSVTERAA
jgi:glycosyltransferase involved in cell wall biosynthesis